MDLQRFMPCRRCRDAHLFGVRSRVNLEIDTVARYVERMLQVAPELARGPGLS